MTRCAHIQINKLTTTSFVSVCGVPLAGFRLRRAQTPQNLELF